MWFYKLLGHGVHLLFNRTLQSPGIFLFHIAVCLLCFVCVNSYVHEIHKRLHNMKYWGFVYLWYMCKDLGVKRQVGPTNNTSGYTSNFIIDTHGDPVIFTIFNWNQIHGHSRKKPQQKVQVFWSSLKF